MTSDLDIYRSVNVLIREHGENAVLEAAAKPRQATVACLLLKN